MRRELVVELLWRAQLCCLCCCSVVTATLLPAQRSVAVEYQPGIDVSNHQGSINWASVENAGIKFAFAKATEGVDFVDARFTSNMNNAQSAGVFIGPYHFARPDSFVSDPLDAVKEANDFVDAIAPFYSSGRNYLRPVLDVERLPGLSTTAANRQFLSEWVRDFIAVVDERLGFAPIIYANSNYVINYFETDLAQYDLWLANWTNNTNNLPPASADGIWNGWDFWQWTSTGSVAGIAGNVDRNQFQGTMADLLQRFVPGFLAGDYDGDNTVDASDYTVWRDTSGRSVTPGSGADGDGSGIVDAADYTLWKSHYGASAASIATQGAAVPEPAMAQMILLALAVLAITFNRCVRFSLRNRR